jgi:hypothetical protein
MFLLTKFLVKLFQEWSSFCNYTNNYFSCSPPTILCFWKTIFPLNLYEIDFCILGYLTKFVEITLIIFFNNEALTFNKI